MTWFIAVKGRSVGRRIQVYQVTEDGTVMYRHSYYGIMKPDTMSVFALNNLYQEERCVSEEEES